MATSLKCPGLGLDDPPGVPRFGHQEEKSVRYFARFTAATRPGYGFTAFPFHHSLSGPNSKIAKCKCGVRASAFPVDPTKPMTSPRSTRIPSRSPSRTRPSAHSSSNTLPFHRTGIWCCRPVAEEQFADGSGYHRMHGCPSRLQNVDRLMPMSVVNFFESIPQIREGESADGRSHIENGRGRANSKNHREKHGNANAEPQVYSSERMTGVPRRITGESAASSLCRINPWYFCIVELRFLIPRTRPAFHL